MIRELFRRWYRRVARAGWTASLAVAVACWAFAPAPGQVPVDATLAADDAASAAAARDRALETAPSGGVVAWRGHRSAIDGAIVPRRSYLARNGMYCREFEETTRSPRETTIRTRLACRGEAGAWILIR